MHPIWEGNPSLLGKYPRRVCSTKCLVNVISLGERLNCPFRKTDRKLCSSSWESLFSSACLLYLQSWTGLAIQPWIPKKWVLFFVFLLLRQHNLTSSRPGRHMIFQAICTRAFLTKHMVEREINVVQVQMWWVALAAAVKTKSESRDQSQTSILVTTRWRQHKGRCSSTTSPAPVAAGGLPSHTTRASTSL